MSMPDREWRKPEIRHALQPFDLLIAVIVVIGVILFIWWRIGMPGRSRIRRRGRTGSDEGGSNAVT